MSQPYRRVDPRPPSVGRRPLIGSRGGNVAITVAVAIFVLVGAAGLAIDGGRAWLMRSRLLTSLDAAAVAVARIYTVDTDVNTLRPTACAVFWANFGRSGGTTPCGGNAGSNVACASNGATAEGYLGARAGTPTVLVAADGTLTIGVSAQLSTSLVRVLGISTVDTCSAAAAQRSLNAVEIGLALDVSGSMYDSGKMPAVRTAATNFTTSIFTRANGAGRTWMSLVPYSSHVNIGTANYARNMVTAASLANFNGLLDSRAVSVGWAGCVQARFGQIGTTTGDLTDTPPSLATPNSQFNAWFFDTTLTSGATPTSRYTITTQASGGGTVTFVPGDNQWRSFIAGNTAVNNFAINEWALNYNVVSRRRTDVGTLPVLASSNPLVDPLDITGPNLGCLLESRYQILPLTGTQSNLTSRIALLEPDPWLYHQKVDGVNAVTYGGTIVHLGLHAAWTTVSPNWSGLWSDTPTTPALPLTTTNAGVKVIVIMTDGVTQMPRNIATRRNGGVFFRGAPTACSCSFSTNSTDISRGYCNASNAEPPRSPTTVRDPNPPTFACLSRGFTQYTVRSSSYGPYGYLDAGAVLTTGGGVPTGGAATNFGLANAEFNRRFAQLCTNIKARGIQIFIVGFDIASAVSGFNATAALSGEPTTTEATIRSALQSCTNNASTNYVEAANASDLNAAFQRVADTIGRIRIVR